MFQITDPMIHGYGTRDVSPIFSH